MRRLIAAAVLAGLILCFCLLGHRTVRRVCAETEQLLSDAQTDRERIVEAQKHWAGCQTRLAFFVNHDDLDEINTLLVQLAVRRDTDGQEEVRSLLECKLEAVSEGQRFSLKDIL